MSSTPATRLPRRWSAEDIKEILAGASSHDPASSRDRAGLSPVAAAAMIAAARADSLIPLLELLEPSEEETTQLDRVLSLLETVAEAQIRLERRLAGIEARLAGRPGSSAER